MVAAGRRGGREVGQADTRGAGVGFAEARVREELEDRQQIMSLGPLPQSQRKQRCFSRRQRRSGSSAAPRTRSRSRSKSDRGRSAARLASTWSTAFARSSRPMIATPEAPFETPGSIQACQLQNPCDSARRARRIGSFTCSYRRPSSARRAACSRCRQTGQPSCRKRSRSWKYVMNLLRAPAAAAGSRVERIGLPLHSSGRALNRPPQRGARRTPPDVRRADCGADRARRAPPPQPAAGPRSWRPTPRPCSARNR